MQAYQIKLTLSGGVIMILTVDSRQKKSYIFSKRHLIEALLSPEKGYGTEAGSQLSFLSQVVSFQSGRGQGVSFLPLKTIGRSSMPKAGYLRANYQNNSFSSPVLLSGYSFTFSPVNEKKKASRKRIDCLGLPSIYLVTREKMRKFSGGVDSPTEAKNYKIPRRYHA